MGRGVTRVPADNRRETRSPARLVSFQALLGVLLLAALAGASVWAYERLTDPGFLPIRVVHIEGDCRYLRKETLERAVAGQVSGGFFGVDVHEVGAVAGSLAWVDKVSVRRVWPNVLRMYVVEQVPLARWGSDSLINERGEVFTPGDGSGPEGLPALDGPEGSAAKVAEALRSMERVLEPLGLDIRRLQLDARGSWSVELDGGLQLRLGSSGAEAQLARFVRLYPRLAASREERPELVDLRYANGFSVRWSKETAPGGSGQAARQTALGDRSDV